MSQTNDPKNVEIDTSATGAEETSEGAPTASSPPAAESEAHAPRTPAWKKAVGVGAGLAALIFLYVAFSIVGKEEAPPLALAGDHPAVSDVEPDSTPADSLGFRFTEVRDLWNSLDRPPQISHELRRVPEGGDLDSFFHRFDSSAEVLGAYQDDNDFVVALLARAHIASGDAQYMYLHLCHMLHPFSPECIDNYFEKGLGGQTLEELAETDARASWEFEGIDWEVAITNDVITIRVQAPNSS